MEHIIQQEIHIVGHLPIDWIFQSKRIWEILSLWNKLKLNIQDKRGGNFFSACFCSTACHHCWCDRACFLGLLVLNVFQLQLD